jgi:hypothetical protein
MKYIIFSTQFPKIHPRVGEPTDFVAKIWRSYFDFFEINDILCHLIPKKEPDILFEFLPSDIQFFENLFPKGQTIRKGQRWVKGDFFNAKIWAGKPYKSKQVSILESLRILKVYHFERDMLGIFFLEGKALETDIVEVIAKNDGLSLQDFMDWFPYGFEGQIIVWSDEIDYSFDKLYSE